MPIRLGKLLDDRLPYIGIVVSADGKSSNSQIALIDTGFNGFVSIPEEIADSLGLVPHTTTYYALANGGYEVAPVAYGFACLRGDQFVKGAITIMGASAAIGMDFLLRCGKALVLSKAGIVLADEEEFAKGLPRACS